MLTGKKSWILFLVVKSKQWKPKSKVIVINASFALSINASFALSVFIGYFLMDAEFSWNSDSWFCTFVLITLKKTHYNAYYYNKNRIIMSI